MRHLALNGTETSILFGPDLNQQTRMLLPAFYPSDVHACGGPTKQVVSLIGDHIVSPNGFAHLFEEVGGCH